MAAYYNEIDPYAAQWLRNLIDAGHIAPGDVDERDIRDVAPDDLAGYRQCHFFAGIGGWPLALRIAGVPDAYPCWTGSPPCQDASVAGAIWGVRSGLAGNRTSLVGNWLDLIDAVRPSALAFENVPGLKPWIGEITGRLAGAGYRVSEPKCSTKDVGGPHLRRRLWVIADRDGEGFQEPRAAGSSAPFSDPRRTPPGDFWVATASRACGLDDGFPRRVDAVRAFGNAIDPWAAASVIKDYREGRAA
ncbi:DNA cytosine methyltransferase [Pelagibius litoralis]|uniref:DNA cytosine methyltransferase n=1 Tax=Pelagibius litoralis TaxID=374515 RepID=A0A967F3R6_9PROT|nr:DNA cytosine methyltransferase [Pelagibius litoralis]NIA72291.1 DNA cytosine methyltransferase [Pelagibius litoralis]